MGKLGKKARKFAQKNLQSVLKQRRKFKAKRESYRRKGFSGAKGNAAGDFETDQTTVGPEAILANEDSIDLSLDSIFSEDSDDQMEEELEEDDLLPEDPYFASVDGGENRSDSMDINSTDSLTGQNHDLQIDFLKQKEKLEKLKKKDPNFSVFLMKHCARAEVLKSEQNSDAEDEEIDPDEQIYNKKLLTNFTIDAWCKAIKEQHEGTSALPNLLNGFHYACHYGSDHDDLPYIIQNGEAFCKILMFVLCEVDGLFRRLLGISCSCKKEAILELQNTSKWKMVKLLVMSYLRSVLYLVNQVADNQMLSFILSRLRSSVIFFSVFPLLLKRLIKVSIHLWVTGGGSLSTSAFFVIRDMASHLGIHCYEILLKKTYKAYMNQFKFTDVADPQHAQFLRDTIVDLYSLDMKSAYPKVGVSIQQLAKILQRALKTKKKEALKSICNWQYMSGVEVWVKLISANIKDHDLQPLLYSVTEIVNGTAHLFPGPRYLPLRLKCVQMLNMLSSSSGAFIPITAPVLSCIECFSKSNCKSGKEFNFLSILKVPKQLLKSSNFQTECIHAAIKLLCAHFSQWSYHIAFPDLAIISLIRLKKFHEETKCDNVRPLLKRLIEQVQQNVEFINKKREEVAFLPKDQENVDSFLRLERTGNNTPFTQYYASVLQRSSLRNSSMTKTQKDVTQKSLPKGRKRIHMVNSKAGTRESKKQRGQPS